MSSHSYSHASRLNDRKLRCRADSDLPTCRCEISPSRTKRNNEWRRILSLRRATRELELLGVDGVSVPMERKIPWGHLRFAKVTDQALLTSVGHEVRAVVERCTERRLGRKKFPKSFFSGLEIRRGDHLKPVQDWLQPLLDEDFGEEGLPFSFRSKWFRRETWTRKQGSRVLEYVVYFPRIPRWMLEFGYRRHYHTHCWVPDGAVLTEKDHIRGYLSVNNAWDLLHGRFYANRSYDMSLDRTHFLEAISFREALEEAELFYRDVDDFLNISDNATCRTSQTAHGSGQKKPNLSCTRTPPVVVHP